MRNEKPHRDLLAEDNLGGAKAAEAQLHRIIDAIPVPAWRNLSDGSNEARLQHHDRVYRSSLIRVESLRDGLGKFALERFP
jgi:hypothetical protein